MRAVFSFVSLPAALAMSGRTSNMIKLDEEKVVQQSYGMELVNGNNVLYTAWVGIGSPRQDVKMVFDTGSSHFWVNSEMCNLQVCKDKNQFISDKSASFTQLTNRHGRDVGYGSGYVRMLFGMDKVWLGDKALPKDEMIGVAYEMDPDAFTELPNDGIIGIGPIHGLSQSERPESLLSYFKETNALPRNIFSVYLSPGTPGSLETKGWIEFGDIPKRYVADPSVDLAWIPIKKGGKWWEMKLMDVYVGEKSTGYCRRHHCSAVADTGSTDVAVPMSDFRMLHKYIKTSRDCSKTNNIPPLTFIFETANGKSARLTIPGSQFVMSYTHEATGTTHCETYLRPLPPAFAEKSTYVLGTPFLRQYLSVYDFENDMVGFTLANQNPPDAAGLNSGEDVWDIASKIADKALSYFM